MPAGWFRIADSEALRPGSVQVCRINGKDVVAFRDHDGRVAVVDPTCPHMGAHLGHRGRVVDGALRCPFHGLRFDVRGRCVGSEYPGDPKVDLELSTWPVAERLGYLFVHVRHEPQAPTWELPEYEVGGWTKPITRVLRLKAHVQDIAENAVDFGHFAAVHAYSDLRDPALRIDGPRLYSRFGFTRKNPFLPGGKVDAVFDTDVHGFGLSVTDLVVPKLGIHYRVILCATQVDADSVEFAIGLSSEYPPPIVPRALRRAPLPWRGLTHLQMRVVHRFVVSDVLQDEPIWAHRTHLHEPALIPGDGPIAKFRRWAHQFYDAST